MSRAMKKITVFVVCVLFFANVMPIVAETPEVKEAGLDRRVKTTLNALELSGSGLLQAV